MAAMISDALSGDKISAILNSAGPVVSCVYIPGDTGIAEEVQLDMTPKLAAPKTKLGGSPTFAGTITALDVVIMCLREPAWGAKPNTHVLPVPMDKAQIPGPILMIRMDEHSEPQHFTLQEYTTYKANPTPPPAEEEVSSSSSSSSSSSTTAAAAPAGEDAEEDDDDDDDEEEEMEEEDGDSDGDEDYMEHVIKRIAIVFKQQTGRDPTAEEVEALIANMNGDPDEAPSGEEEGEGEGEGDAVAVKTETPEEPAAEPAVDEVEALEAMSPEDMVKLLRSKMAEAFTQSQGRAPTEDEIDALLAQMSQDTELQDGLLRAGQQQQQEEQQPETPAGTKRKLETNEDTELKEHPAKKKTSPASVTETAAAGSGN